MAASDYQQTRWMHAVALIRGAAELAQTLIFRLLQNSVHEQLGRSVEQPLA